MKITIAKGQNVDEALEQVKAFLKEKYPEYPKIKEDSSLYITLKTEDGQTCPDNEKEFTILKNTITDISEYNKRQALDGIKMLWRFYKGWRIQ